MVDPVQLTETSPFRSFKKGTEGSNVFLSAIESDVQRKQPAILVKSLELAVIARIFHAKRTGESVLPNPAGRLSHLFLWEASEQSAFKDSIRRMQYDHKPMKSWGIGPFTFTEFTEENRASEDASAA